MNLIIRIRIINTIQIFYIASFYKIIFYLLIGDHFCECNTNDLKIIKYLKSLENAWPIIPPQPIKEKYVKNDKSYLY